MSSSKGHPPKGPTVSRHHTHGAAGASTHGRVCVWRGGTQPRSPRRHGTPLLSTHWEGGGPPPPPPLPAPQCIIVRESLRQVSELRVDQGWWGPGI